MDAYRKTAGSALAHLRCGQATEGVSEALHGSDADTDEALQELKADEAMTRKALGLLASRRNDRYEAAVAALREDTRDWWADRLACEPENLDEGEGPYAADPDSLRRFIETQVQPWYGRRRIELTNRPLVREQAYGESLQAEKLEVLARYEVHLDRKLERMLTMLVRLKELRSGCGNP